MVSDSTIRHEVERISRLMRAEAQGRLPAGGQASVAPMALPGAKDPPLSPTTSDVKSTARAEDAPMLSTPHESRQLDVSVLLEGSRALRRTQLEAYDLSQQLHVERQHRLAERAHEQAMSQLRAEWEYEREQLKLESVMVTAHQEEARELARQLQSEAMAAAANQEAECMTAAALRNEVTRSIVNRDAVSDDLSIMRSERDAAQAEIDELLAWQQAAIATEQLQADNLLAQKEETRLELSQHRDNCTMIRAELEARTRASNARLQAAELEETAAQRHGFEAQLWLRSAESEAKEALAMAREMTRSEAAGKGQEAAAYHALAVGEAHAQAEAKKLAAKLVDVENASVLGTAGLILFEQKGEEIEAAQMVAMEETEAMESWREEASYYKQEYLLERFKQESMEQAAANKAKSPKNLRASFNLTESPKNRRATVSGAPMIVEDDEGEDDTSSAKDTQLSQASFEDPAKKANAAKEPRNWQMRKSEVHRDDKIRRHGVVIGHLLRTSQKHRGQHLHSLKRQLSSHLDNFRDVHDKFDVLSPSSRSSPSKQDEEPEHSFHISRAASSGSLGSLNVIEDAENEDSDGNISEEVSLVPKALKTDASRKLPTMSVATELWDPGDDDRESAAASFSMDQFGNDDYQDEQLNADLETPSPPAQTRAALQSNGSSALFASGVERYKSPLANPTSSLPASLFRSIDAQGRFPKSSSNTTSPAVGEIATGSTSLGSAWSFPTNLSDARGSAPNLADVDRASASLPPRASGPNLRADSSTLGQLAALRNSLRPGSVTPPPSASPASGSQNLSSLLMGRRNAMPVHNIP